MKSPQPQCRLEHLRAVLLRGASFAATRCQEGSCVYGAEARVHERGQSLAGQGVTSLCLQWTVLARETLPGVRDSTERKSLCQNGVARGHRSKVSGLAMRCGGAEVLEALDRSEVVRLWCVLEGGHAVRGEIPSIEIPPEEGPYPREEWQTLPPQPVNTGKPSSSPPAPQGPALEWDFWDAEVLRLAYDHATLGARLMARRCVKGLGQRVLALSADVPLDWLRGIEAGKGRVPRGNLERLARELDTSPEYLILGESDARQS